MSADNYRLVPEKVVISEPLMFTGLVEDYRSHINPNDFQDQKELELALRASEEAARNVDLTEAQVMKLSYKNICDIDHLDGLNMLHTLALDNNVISRIENLGHLTNLTWLDLSFNNITKIEGLETLVKLKDLTLYHNKIETVQNLEALESLECLSLGKNMISSLDCIGYLRKFPKLRMLNLEGNPLCNEEEYRLYALGFIPQIDYLDFVMISEDERLRAVDTFQDELMILQEKEVIEKTTKEREAAQKAENELLKAANLSVVQHLFEDMLEEDSELSKLRMIAGVNEMLEDYQDKVNAACEEFREVGLEQYELRKKEISKFEGTISIRQDAAAQKTRSLVEDFNAEKSSTFSEVMSTVARVTEEDSKFSGIEDLHHAQRQLRNLLSLVDELADKLIDIEVKRLEVQDKMLNEFESRYGDIKNRNLELQNNCFRKVEDYETEYSTQLGELCNSLAEKLANGELEHFTEEARELIGNKEVLDTAIQGSNDIHIGKLLAREDETRAEETAMFKNTLARYKEEKLQTSRDRLKEIKTLSADLKKEINNVLRDVMERADDEF